MMKLKQLIATGCIATLSQVASAGIVVGVLDDFEDGTLGGWSPPNASNTSNVPGGPSGSTRALEIAPASRLAAFDAGADIKGAMAPGVTAITVDMLRADGADPLDVRLVLFGPGTNNRWTSTAAQVVPGSGDWNNYVFSVLEGDLTRTRGTGSYADLVGNISQIMFRYDSGGPSATGTPVTSGIGSLTIDNVSAVPLPAAAWLFLGALTALGLGARRRSQA